MITVDNLYRAAQHESGQPLSMPAADSSPFRRPICEPLLKCRRVEHGAKAVADAVRWQVDVHVPFERRVIEPFNDFHPRIVEGQRYLERKVSIDL